MSPMNTDPTQHRDNQAPTVAPWRRLYPGHWGERDAHIVVPWRRTSSELEKVDMPSMAHRRWRHFIACLAYPLRRIPKAWRDWRRGYTLAARDSMLRKLTHGVHTGEHRRFTRPEMRAFRDHCILIGPGDV